MRNVLISGGAGFFGKGMVRRLLNTDVERICIFSRDEWKHAQMLRELGNDSRLRFFLGDVRDKSRLFHAMDGIDTVFHAAALKRVEAIEYNPTEAVLTNVMGSMNVIEAAIDAKVHKVVALSTDKACSPVNAYGASKLMLEKLFLAIGKSRATKSPLFTVCRYGNVFGSTGSVLPIWRKMLNDGHVSVPVTDPECTRFFMTLDQAVDLVYNAAISNISGDLVVPDLPAYRLADLAEALGAEMQIIGLPAGEKLHEEMVVGQPSSEARRMSVEELRQELSHV